MSYESDRECYQFLQDLVDRQIFQSLIERWVEADAQVGIYLFKKRLDQLEDSSLQLKAAQPYDERALALDRKDKIVNMCPFFDIMELSRLEMRDKDSFVIL